MISTIRSRFGGVSFVDPAKDSDLRRILLRAHDSFKTYRDHFEDCGVTRQHLTGSDLHAAFSQITPIGKATYAQLQGESFQAQSHTRFVVDPSSGTTGAPVLKFTSRADDAAEGAAVRIAFEKLGIGPANRCACLDIGASQIYLFYMNILREHGVIDPMFFKVTTDFEHTAQQLRTYDPDVLISVPSVLKRCLSALKSVYKGDAGLGRKILYIGEPMEDPLRIEVQQLFKAECYSFYGTTEVGSVCIECPAHTGMHIPLELFVPTIHPWPSTESECAVGPSRYRGVVAWTSLQIRDQPVVKYAVKDLVDIDLSPCECGCTSPRLTFRHRVDEAFFLYGITFTYQFFLEIIEGTLDQPVQLEIRVVHAGSQKLSSADLVVLTMDESFRSSENKLRTAVTGIHPLSELVWSNFLQVQFEFVVSSQLARRKGRRVRLMGGPGTTA